MTDHPTVGFVLTSLYQMVSPWTWRGRFTTAHEEGIIEGPLVTSPEDLQAQLENPPPLPREHVERVVALVQVLEYALRPWITGEAELAANEFALVATAIRPQVVLDRWDFPIRTRQSTPADLAIHRFFNPRMTHTRERS